MQIPHFQYWSGIKKIFVSFLSSLLLSYTFIISANRGRLLHIPDFPNSKSKKKKRKKEIRAENA